MLHELFTSGKIDLRQTTAQLFQTAQDYFTPDREPHEHGTCLSLDDQYDLAVGGTWGTLDQVQRDLLAFLEPYAARLRASRQS